MALDLGWGEIERRCGGEDAIPISAPDMIGRPLINDFVNTGVFLFVKFVAGFVVCGEKENAGFSGPEDLHGATSPGTVRPGSGNVFNEKAKVLV